MGPVRHPPPPPAPDRLPSLPVHTVVRRWPETLAILRARLDSVEGAGTRPLSSVAEDPEALLAAVHAATRWREEATP